MKIVCGESSRQCNLSTRIIIEMVQVKSFFQRYSLRTGSIFVLSLYLVLGLSFFIAEIVCLKGEFEIVSLTLLALVLIGKSLCIVGIAGVFVKKSSLLVPILFLKLIFLVVAAFLFILYIFGDNFPISKAINHLAHMNKGVFVILYLMSEALGVYFWIVVHSYYMKELKEGSAPRRSDNV